MAANRAKAKRSRSGSGSIAVPAPADQQESVSIRKIANGYIINRSGMHRGKYRQHEEFSAGRPVVSTAAPKAKPTPSRRRPTVAGNEVGYLKGAQ